MSEVKRTWAPGSVTRVLAQPGTVSHGTMRDEDLLDAFGKQLDALLKLQPRGVPRNQHRRLVRMALAGIGKDGELKAGSAIYPPTDLVMALFDALDEYAPAGHSFMAHPGDGSDYGYWPHEEE